MEIIKELRDRATLRPDTEMPPSLLSDTRAECGFTAQEISAADKPATYEWDEPEPTTMPGAVGPMKIYENLGKALKAKGLEVRKVEGWRTRSAGSSFAPRGIMFHHTASAASSGNAPCLGIVTRGRSDLPGPLCNFLVGRNGTIYIVAAGRANHAGVGGPLRGIPRDSGNGYLFGVECENNGVGENWSDKQKDAIATLYAVLLKRMGRSPRMLMGHKEWTDRKIDPKGISMKNFRDRVGKELRRIK